jgi:hypothetical protein
VFIFLLCVQVEAPRVQPKLSEPFLGFTQTAEIWNSRACMIGLIGTFIVELVMDGHDVWGVASILSEFRSQRSMDRLLNFQVLNKGILQMIGVEVGKGLDLPLWRVTK